MSKLELEITCKAYNDMETIANFIAKDNKSAANKMLKLFYKTFDTFTNHPNIGKIRKDFTYLDVRFYVIKKNYLIVYRIIDNTKLRILRVLTAYQDICKEL
ncbi:type II toxin-antitoxin system RelE/ParE family toxin [bacterium]|nr:type II toxin-antitoxin system RelE/ParE family toxin [bacterium]